MSTKNKMWGGVFVLSQSELMTAINESISFDKEMFREDIQASIAHSKMLAKQGIITNQDQLAIENGLIQIKHEIEAGEFVFKTELEDIHMNIESRLVELIGEAGKRLHTARSRNDQVATDFKIYTRSAFETIITSLTNLIKTLIKRAEENIETIMPGFTHLQIAQPISLAHHLMAYVAMFERDLQKAKSFLEHLNASCPLGACALAGTSYNTDPFFTAKELGFNSPSVNSLDAVSDRDFALDFLYLSSLISSHLSRLCEEIIIWSSQSFSFISLPDEFSTGSSIMPQKRNPDAAELVRGKTGRIFGNLISLLTTLKGLPLAYSKDMQEDKERLFDSFKSITICLQAIEGMIQKIQFNTQNLHTAASNGYSTATDLADYLVKVLGKPFREAHHITGQIVRLAMAKSIRLDQLSLAEIQTICPNITQDIFDILSVEHSVKSKTSFGGTSPLNIQTTLNKARIKYQ